MIIAHKDNNDRTQSLEDHLLNVALHCKELGDKVGLGNFCFLAGALHDCGKADRRFQNKIINGSTEKVIHSSAGVKYIFTLARQLYKKGMKNYGDFIETASYVIGAHHGLFDSLRTDDNNNYFSSIHYKCFYDKEGDYNYEDDILGFLKEFEKLIIEKTGKSFSDYFLKAHEEYVEVFNRLDLDKTNRKEFEFYNFITVRLLLSILKTADVLDTINSIEEVIPREREFVSGEALLKSIEDVYKKFGEPKSKINKVKTKIADEVKNKGFINGPGVYKLDIPTGSGKTLASSRYAAAAISTGKFEKLIYVTAFLSVLEQNAQELKKVFGDENVLEHHSNIVEDSNEIDEYKEDTIEFKNKEYLIDTWDERIVATTMVQFFNSLMKGKSGNIRRFASLINSVIVLDEVQSLPIETTYIFNLFCNYLSRIMGVNLVLCTATQPDFDNENIEYRIKYGGLNEEEDSLYTMSEEDMKPFRRNKISLLNGTTEEASIEDIIKEIEMHKDRSTLIIVNTKKTATLIFNEIEEKYNDCYLLSTDFCPAHRKDIIKEMKEKLNLGVPVICVSTQLIEAGVDIDFQSLIRSFAGIDSLCQADGRCNRAGLLEFGEVKLVNLSNEIECTKYLKGVNHKKEIANVILSIYRDELDLNKLNGPFYDKYFSNRAELMSYPLEEDKLDLFGLITEKKIYNDYKDVSSGATSSKPFSSVNQPFKKISEIFELIDEDSQEGVIVYYRDNEEIIEELIDMVKEYEKTYDGLLLKKIKKILKSLQPYTVNVRKSDIHDRNFIKYLDGKISILPKELYSNKRGLDIKRLDEANLIF
ncbi:CRISPR-associated helicase Cas3' [Lagierella sp.]|uniref:CRISPR-associated helicase Cas3' n=1 Tax=Lagierella sp. TaxID=2849657 RepID=UPI0026322A4E|nr:CRISPR-associated helicase Cas3' [Lagierella sp.]